jgi:deoxyhypusine synthase
LKILLQFIYSGIKDFQSKRYRQFMLLAEEISTIRDDFISLRLEGINRIVDALKYNEQYSSDSNIIQQWLVILFNRNEHLRNHLMSEVEILDYLYTLTSKKVPSDEISKKNVCF